MLTDYLYDGYIYPPANKEDNELVLYPKSD